MGKALIIAEKPSVAGDIAKALGGFARHEDYYESDRYVVSSAVGHLLELCIPPECEVKRGKWTFAHLPVIPPHFDLRPIEKTESRLKLLAKLVKRKDVDSLINACDAGREGELIFRYLVRYLNSTKPIQRLWLQSMTPAAIREGFTVLRDDESMRPLADAAVCRSEADWLVGINGTRAMTAFNSKTGGFQLTTVGRVQTPTLAIVVEREEKIKKFVPRDYSEVHGTFLAQAGEYVGRWFDEAFKNGESELERAKRLLARFKLDLPDAEQRLELAHGSLEEEHRTAVRLWYREIAETIKLQCLGKPGIVVEESKPSTSISPLLYDLTSLQRDANSRFGFSAKNTLGLAQALYERHKVLTYPRTDARALPEDYIGTVGKTMESLCDIASYSSFAGKVLSQEWVRPNKRIFNNAKISDHFAIIPTGVLPKGLSEPEQKLYDLVTRRFLAVFYPAAEFLVTTRITRVEGEPFKTEGKVCVKAGWLEVYGKEAQTDDDAPSLVPVQPNEMVKTSNIEVKATVTKPPPRYTEATLLGAMESAGKLVDDEGLREAMSERGLGTPATRAATIEGLIFEQYIFRNGRELQPTAKAFGLMTLLNGLGIQELIKPELTGNWEFQLRQMERGQLRREQFMTEIRNLTERIVGQTKSYEHDTIPGDFGKLNSPCPKCGSELHENYKKFQCQNEKCDFALWKIVAGRAFAAAEIEELLTKRVIGPLQGFRSKLGKPFAAMIKLTPEFKAEFDFGQNDNAGDKPAEEVDFSGQEPLGTCPKCGARVFENGLSYVCEKATGPNRTCAFRSGKIILQRQIEREQMTKLLATGKTGLIDKFISKKGRPFSAYLVAGKDGKVGFEFEPRAPKGAKGRAKSADDPAKPKEPVAKIDFTGQEPLGKCPRCGGRVFESEKDYLCEKSQADSRPCKFKSGKVILQRSVAREQMTKLLATGKTDLIDSFISKAGRPFSAYLVKGDDGKIGFEFPPRD